MTQYTMCSRFGQLTIQVPIGSTKDIIGSVQGVFTRLLARVQLLDGLQKQAEAVI